MNFTRPRHPSERRFHGMSIQIKYTMLLTLVAGFTTLIMIFVMAWFIQRNYSLFMGDELGVSAQVVQIVRHEQKILELSLFLLFLVSIAVTFTVALFVTRKLTGPMIALERHLWLLSQGDWSRDFRLRHNDEFREMESVVNQLRKQYLGAAPTPEPTQKKA
jgi:signal transduction histidine kinase